MSKSPAKQVLEESLSALVDGELTELELRRLLKTDDQEFEALRSRWLSYQTASSSIKSEVPDVDYSDLSASISAVIADEPAHSVKQSKPKLSIWSGVGRFAVAASVAGAVVLGVQFAPNNLDGQIANVDPATVKAPSVPGSFSHGLPTDATISTVSHENSPAKPRVQNGKTIVLTQDTQKQLQQAEEQVNRLMIEHAQNTSQNTQQGILPFARVPKPSKDQ